MSENSPKTFEQLLAELEKTVRQLEAGELTLDQSLAAFERGIGLARQCEESLKKAKGRVEQIIKNDPGEMAVVPFEVKE